MCMYAPIYCRRNICPFAVLVTITRFGENGQSMMIYEYSNRWWKRVQNYNIRRQRRYEMEEREKSSRTFEEDRKNTFREKGGTWVERAIAG
jgi:hypothetical protein